MKVSDAKLYLPFVQAMAEGKTVQFNASGHWVDYLQTDNTHLDCSVGNLRIKPTPRLRAWRPEEVPVICWIRSKNNSGTRCSLLAVGPRVVTYFDTTIKHMSYLELVEACEHSTDNGITWKPCGVEE